MTSFSHFSRASAHLIKDYPTIIVPKTEQKAAEPLSYTWEGIIFAREWDADWSEQEYQCMRMGGNRKHFEHPDAVSLSGAPIFVITDGERREASRLLNRNCRNMVEFRNVACNAGRNVLLNFLATTAGQTGIAAFAVGNGVNVNPSSSDTTLSAEIFRKAIAAYTVSGNSVDLSAVFLTTDTGSNATYTEAGIFGNGASTNSPPTTVGTLFAHASYNYTKASNTNLSSDYFIYFN